MEASLHIRNLASENTKSNANAAQRKGPGRSLTPWSDLTPQCLAGFQLVVMVWLQNPDWTESGGSCLLGCWGGWRSCQGKGYEKLSSGKGDFQSWEEGVTIVSWGCHMGSDASERVSPTKSQDAKRKSNLEDEMPLRVSGCSRHPLSKGGA